jgi:hypothetical protein
MRRARLGIVLGVTFAMAAIAACALDESGSAVPDTGAPDAIGGDVLVKTDGGFDAVVDVGFDVPDLGVGETESGLPCTCVTSIPAGYWVVEYDPTDRPNCSTGYANHTDFTETTGAPNTCACTCTPTPTQQPTCTCGSPATFHIASGNGECTDVTTESLQAKQATDCNNNNQSLTPGNHELNNMQASLATANECGPMANGTCAKANSTNTTPNAVTIQGRSCPLDAGLGTCNGSQVCIPTQGTGYGLCVTNGTTTPGCPPGDFPIAHQVGTNYTDTRNCGPDPCGCIIVDGGTCATPQLRVFSGSNSCNPQNGTSYTLPVDNATCVQVGYDNGTTFTSTDYSIALEAGAACGYSGTFAPTGGIQMTGGYTICCHP